MSVRTKETQALQSNSQLKPASSEATALERRVLAHERALQALIAYLIRSEPPHVDHSREVVVEPMRLLCPDKAQASVIIAGDSL